MYIAKLLINVFDAVETIMTSCKLVSKPVSYTHLTLPTNREV